MTWRRWSLRGTRTSFCALSPSTTTLYRRPASADASEGRRRSSPQYGACLSTTLLACLQSSLRTPAWPCRRHTATPAAFSASSTVNTGTVAAHALTLCGRDRRGTNNRRGRNRSVTGINSEEGKPSGTLYTRRSDEPCLKYATRREQVRSINVANIGSARILSDGRAQTANAWVFIHVCWDQACDSGGGVREISRC